MDDRAAMYAEADAEREASIAAGTAFPVGSLVVGRGWPRRAAPGTVVSNGAGVVRVEQPGVGVVPWSVLDAGRELTVVDPARDGGEPK